MKDSKILFGLVILALGIGFATISTTLYINGTLKAKSNPIGDVVFDIETANVGEGTNIATRSGNGTQTVSFTTNELTTIGAQSVFNFRVYNKSAYPVLLNSITCSLDSSTAAGFLELTTPTIASDDTELEANTYSSVYPITVKMVKTYNDSTAIDAKVTCSVNVSFKS